MSILRRQAKWIKFLQNLMTNGVIGILSLIAYTLIGLIHQLYRYILAIKNRKESRIELRRVAKSVSSDK